MDGDMEDGWMERWLGGQTDDRRKERRDGGRWKKRWLDGRKD